MKQPGCRLFCILQENITTMPKLFKECLVLGLVFSSVVENLNFHFGSITMKVFISWSGDKSKKVGLLLSNWIPFMFQTVQPWLSFEDIGLGTRWYLELSKALEETKFAIICLTKENVTSPWINFEAGSLSKSIEESYVIPYLIDLDVDEFNGPLKFFQATTCSKEGTFNLIKQISKGNEFNFRKEQDLEYVFNTFWPDFEARLNEILTLPEIKQRASHDQEIYTDDKTRELNDIIYAFEHFHSNPEGIFYIGETLLRCDSFVEENNIADFPRNLIDEIIDEIENDERKEFGGNPLISISKVKKLVQSLKQYKKLVSS